MNAIRKYVFGGLRRKSLKSLKMFCCGLAVLLCLEAFTGCGDGKEDWENQDDFGGALAEDLYPGKDGNEKENGEKGDFAAEGGRIPETGGEAGQLGNSAQTLGNSEGNQGAVSLFDAGRFQGKIRSIKYAGAGKLLVYAEKLSLYDPEADQVLGEYQFPEGQISLDRLCLLSQGYALFGEVEQKRGTGNDSGSSLSFAESTDHQEGMRCWIFDEKLNLKESLDLHRLLKDQEKKDEVEFSAAVTKDGKQIAIAGIRRLYLYQTEENAFRILLDTDSDAKSGNLKNITVTSVCFSGEAAGSSRQERLIFTGIAIPEGKSESVPVYGTMNPDGSGLDCHTVSDFALSQDLLIYEDEIWFLEDFQNAEGKVLVTDQSGKVLRTLKLEGEDTGKDGIFGSDQGSYLATLAIPNLTDDWKGGWRLRIYDSGSGKILWEQNVGMDTETYTGVSCSVKILDGLRECIVTCGRGENTHTEAYFF